jgi:amino acid permease
LHAGYHLTTAIAAPSLLSLPYAFSFLGWAPGLLAITICGLVSSYAYCLLSQVLDDCASKGHRFYRFRELSQFVIGQKWTRFFVIPVQFGVCFVTVIGAILAGGSAVKLIYKGANANGSIPLAEFVAMFGAVMILLSQLPSFHSLRYINLVSVILCLIYSLAATVGSVLAGISLFQKRFIKCSMCPNPLNFLHLLIIMTSWYTKVIIYSLLITDSFPCFLYIVQ